MNRSNRKQIFYTSEGMIRAMTQAEADQLAQEVFERRDAREAAEMHRRADDRLGRYQ